MLGVPWRDDDGDTCDTYAANSPNGPRSGYCLIFGGHIHGAGVNAGLTARAACCACGGGNQAGNCNGALIGTPTVALAGTERGARPPGCPLIATVPVDISGNLSLVDLANNTLTAISRGDFTGPALKTLYLGVNSIAIVEDGAFAELAGAARTRR